MDDTPCAAGRGLSEPPGGNPFWSEPCPNLGTDSLFIVGLPGEGGVWIELCRAHIVALDPRRIA
jgi:hypothetical protein